MQNEPSRHLSELSCVMLSEDSSDMDFIYLHGAPHPAHRHFNHVRHQATEPIVAMPRLHTATFGCSTFQQDGPPFGEAVGFDLDEPMRARSIKSVRGAVGAGLVRSEAVLGGWGLMGQGGGHADNLVR